MPSGFGASVNSFELLSLALAACYCNDVYPEAGKRGIRVDGVHNTLRSGVPVALGQVEILPPARA